MQPPAPVAAALQAAAASWSHDPEGAEAGLTAALEAIERDGAAAAAERARLRARLGQLRVFLGRLDDALRVLYDALALADDGYVALQLGGALSWRGDRPALEEAEGHLARALMAARRNRDGPLAIGALCGRGEILLAAARPREALESFGEALGISEFSRLDAPSVLPLVGLARAHAAGRAPAKAEPLALRALGRARVAGDEPGEARALAALATIQGTPDRLEEAARLADAAPHRPLALRIRCERALRDPAGAASAGAAPADLLERAEAMGLSGDALRLRARRPPDEAGRGG